MTQLPPKPIEPFSVRISLDGDVTAVTVRGEFDLAGVPEFWAGIQAVPPTSSVLAVDLRDVSFLDSSGLNALLTLQQMLVANGRRMVLRAPAQRVRRLFEVAHVADLFEIEG